MIVEWEMALRLLMSGVLGGLIGYEREYQHKSAGLRTHILVCVGSCLIMILSIKLYTAVQGLTNADPARLAAQVVSGIGFLGAGSILKEGPNVRGLTTAASMWVVSGVGLAVGSGYYMGAFMTTGIVFLTLTILSRMELKDHSTLTRMVVKTADQPGQIGQIGSILGQHGVNISDIKITSQGDVLLLRFLLYVPQTLNFNQVTTEVASLSGVFAVTRET